MLLSQYSTGGLELKVPCGTPQEQLKHQCVINTVFHLKPKHNIILDAMKEKSAVPPAKTVMLSLFFHQCWKELSNSELDGTLQTCENAV